MATKWKFLKKKKTILDIPPHLCFGNDLDGDKLTLDHPFLGRRQARVPKMSSSNLLPQLILRLKVLAIPEALIQRSLHLLVSILGDRTLLGFRQALALCEGDPYMLRGRWWREGPPKQSPGGGPRRGGGDLGGKRAGGALLVGAGPCGGGGAGRGGVNGRGGAASASAERGSGASAERGGGGRATTICVSVCGAQAFPVAVRVAVLGNRDVLAVALTHGPRPPLVGRCPTPLPLHPISSSSSSILLGLEGGFHR